MPNLLSTKPSRALLERVYRSGMAIGREIKQRDELVYCVSTGNLPNGGGRLTVHYLGRKRFADDFLMFFERDAVDAAVEQNFRERITFVQFLKKRKDALTCPPDADLFVVDNIFEYPKLPSALTLAPHLNAALPVCKTLDEQLGLVHSKSVRRKLQGALKRGFSWRKTHSLADFNLFYDVMYEPFVKERFRYGGSIVPRAKMKEMYMHRGYLLFVEENGVPVSGALIYISRSYPDSMYYWKYGLADSKALSPALFGERNAATEAMVFQHAVAEGYREVDWGLTQAMPLEGIFTHKKRVGCDFRKTPNAPEFRLLINPAAQVRLLSRCPMIVSQNAQFIALCGLDHPLGGRKTEAFLDTMRACVFPSLGRVRLFTSATGAERQLLDEALATLQKETSVPIDIVEMTN